MPSAASGAMQFISAAHDLVCSGALLALVYMTLAHSKECTKRHQQNLRAIMDLTRAIDATESDS